MLLYYILFHEYLYLSDFSCRFRTFRNYNHFSTVTYSNVIPAEVLFKFNHDFFLLCNSNMSTCCLALWQLLFLTSINNKSTRAVLNLQQDYLR